MGKSSQNKKKVVSIEELDNFFIDPGDSRRLFKDLKSTASELQDLLNNKMGNQGRIRYKDGYLRAEELRLYRQFFNQWLEYETNRSGVRKKRNARFRDKRRAEREAEEREIMEYRKTWYK